MLIKSASTAMAKMTRGAELCRGPVGGWYLYRGTVRIGRVASAAAEEVINSGRVARVDDRASVVGETYKVSATDRALLECEQMAAHWLHLGNLASERGDRDRAERHYARSQTWHDRMNSLLGNG